MDIDFNPLTYTLSFKFRLNISYLKITFDKLEAIDIYC